MHGEKRAKNTRGYSPDDMGSDAMGGYSLDDYIYSLEARGGGGGGGERAGGPIHPGEGFFFVVKKRWAGSSLFL